MPEINEGPTSTVVVAAALNIAQRFASECAKQFISVTYDLAVAKIALKIPATQSPKYENLFVNIGAFYIEMAFFSAIGKHNAKFRGPHLTSQEY